MFWKRKVKDDNIIASKELSIDDFKWPKAWPFRVDKVIIQKRGVLMVNGRINESLLFITVLINGKVIGLNGSSVDHLGAKSILESKYYIKGVSVSKFITIGLKLK